MMHHQQRWVGRERSNIPVDQISHSTTDAAATAHAAALEKPEPNQRLDLAFEPLDRRDEQASSPTPARRGTHPASRLGFHAEAGQRLTAPGTELASVILEASHHAPFAHHDLAATGLELGAARAAT